LRNSAQRRLFRALLRHPKEKPLSDKTAPNAANARPAASNSAPNAAPKQDRGFNARRGGKKKPVHGQVSGRPASENDTYRPAVRIEPKIDPVDASAFAALGLSPAAVTTLGLLGFSTPTPIQMQAIPHGLSGRDVMGLAQTGTGKTAAFGLPLVDHLMKSHEAPMPKAARALILAPTRELVNQISDVLRSFVKRTPLKVVTAVGGLSINAQTQALFRGVDVLVATPGRLLDLLDRRAVRLDQAHFLVLDEADQMLDMGFIVPLKKIVKHLPTVRQTMLFSATMPREIEELSKAYLHNPVRVETAPSGKPADKVSQFVHFLDRKAKTEKLKQMLAEDASALSLVFSRTKHGAEKLMKHLVESGFKASSIHGNKSQSQRDRAIAQFRAGEIRVLVATDVAARGIDIPGVSHVFNYDLPDVAENYVHRIGRTARAGADGIAHAFCSGDERSLLRAIERLTGKPLVVASGDIRALKSEGPEDDRPARPSGFGGHRDGTKNARRQDGFVTPGEEGAPRKPSGFRPNGGKPGFKGPRRPAGGNGNGGRKPQAA
jgi:ATP-dependent RNA helicase RhlE